jgi:2-dehydropantoate 2-reductase
MSEPIVVWGAGAIGGTLGAAFLRAGEEVVFVDRVAEHVAAIRTRGLRIVGPIFEDTVHAPAFLPEEVEGRFRRIFLAVKAQHTREAMPVLAPHLADDGFVVSSQNGLNETVIAEVVGRARTMGCFVNFGADYLEPGVIEFGGRGAVVVGEIDGSRTPRVEALFELMRRFDDRAVLTPDIWGYLWGKMTYGALLFATALTNESIADALARPSWRGVLVRLGREVARVATAEGIVPRGFDGYDPAAFAADATAATIEDSFARMIAHNRKSAKSHSGIWRDLAVRHRTTETDAQIGPVVAIAARHGIPTPVTERLIAMIHEIETGRRPLDAANLDALDAATAETEAVR